MPINFNPIAQQPNLVDILDQLLSGSNTVTSAAPSPAQLLSSSGPTPSQQVPDAQTLLNLIRPEHSASDAYMNMLQQFPQRNQPSTGRNILGTLASLGAGVKPSGIASGQAIGFQGGSPEEIMQAGDLARFRPFYQQLQDWQSKIKPYEAAAVNEKNLNNTLRMMLYDTARTGNQATAIQNRAENESAKRDLDWYKTQIDWYKAQNFELKENDKGEAVAFDKRTGIEKPILKPDGTPAMGEDMAKVKLQGNFAQKRAETMAGAGIQRVKIAAKYRNWQQITDKDTGEVYLLEPGTNKAVKPTADMLETHENQEGIPSTTPSPATPPVSGIKPPVTTPVTTPQKQPTFVAKGTKQPANLAAIQQTTQDTLQALDELLSPDNKLRPEIGKYVGLGRVSGFVEKYIPGAEARTTQAKIDRLRNLLSIELIGEMKTQSRTGATGFGQLSTRELEVLEKAASKLDPGIQKEAFETELIRIKERLRKILMAPGGPDVKRTPDELYEMYRKDKK